MDIDRTTELASQFMMDHAYVWMKANPEQATEFGKRLAELLDGVAEEVAKRHIAEMEELRYWALYGVKYTEDCCPSGDPGCWKSHVLKFIPTPREK